MSIQDHVAILLHSSLAQARPNKANPDKIEFYANVALPPSAAGDLAEQMKQEAPNGKLQGLRLTIEANSRKSKPHPGIPDDWLILRLSSGQDYAPELYTEGGQKLAALPINGGQIRGEFFAGQKVRLNGYPFYWSHAISGATGISWNLSGVMAVGGGERRGGGSGEPSESAFARYLSDTPTSNGQGNSQQGNSQQGNAGQSAPKDDNPFAQQGAGAFDVGDDDIPF